MSDKELAQEIRSEILEKIECLKRQPITPDLKFKVERFLKKICDEYKSKFNVDLHFSVDINEESGFLTISEERACERCSKTIKFNGGYWEHIGYYPDHAAVPIDYQPIIQ